MSIDLIIQYLELLDIEYPPANYNESGSFGCMGWTGSISGPYPLPDSICLQIRLNYCHYLDDSSRPLINKLILDTIYKAIQDDIGDQDVILSRSGREDFMDEYNEVENRFENMFPITTEYISCESEIDAFRRRITDILEITTIMSKLAKELRCNQPTINLYCRQGTKIYDQIARDLYPRIRK